MPFALTDLGIVSHLCSTKKDNVFYSDNNKENIRPSGEEFTITLTLGPRTLPHSVFVHKGSIYPGQNRETQHELTIPTSGGAVTIMLDMAYRESRRRNETGGPAETTSQSRRVMGVSLQGMGDQPRRRRCELYPSGDAPPMRKRVRQKYQI